MKMMHLIGSVKKGSQSVGEWIGVQRMGKFC